MHGFNWFGSMRSGYCGLGYGDSFYGIWPMLILIGVVILVIVLILSRKKRDQHKDNSMDMIKMMYAKGEITEEEYLRKKSILEGK